MSKQNYYELKLKEIQILLSDNQTEQALKILNEELSLSYIPLEYETIFSKIWVEINYQQKQLQSTNTHLNSEQFVEYLFSNDDHKLAKAISLLEEINLKPLRVILKKWIEDGNNDHWIAKVYMLEAMATQEIDINIEYKDFKINPQKFGSIFEKNSIIKIFQEIENLTDKKVYIKSFVFQNFKTFLLINYPKFKYKENLSLTLIKITEHMFDSNIRLTNQELKIFNQIRKF